MKGVITVDGRANINKRNEKVTFKNNAPFTNCISKINNMFIDNTEGLAVVMLMYNLLEYSKYYRKTTGSLCNYYRNEPSNPLSSNSASFNYKTRITRKTTDDSHIIEGVQFFVPSKHLRNFWRSLDIPLTNCEIELILTWSRNYVLADMAVRNANHLGNTFVTAILPPSVATF